MGPTYHRLTHDEINAIADLYVNRKLSSTQVAKEIGCSHRTVLNCLAKLGIDRRTLPESQFAYRNKDMPQELSDFESMYDLYVTKHMTKQALGQKLNCAPHVIDRSLRAFGIHVRGTSEGSIGVQKGASHHNWKGGKCPLNVLCREYFLTNIAPKIRERDGFQCKLCGTHKSLHVHHIKAFASILDEIIAEHPDLSPETNKQELYDIIVQDPRFLDETNLVTYCKDCHLFKIHGYKRKS